MTTTPTFVPGDVWCTTGVPKGGVTSAVWVVAADVIQIALGRINWALPILASLSDFPITPATFCANPPVVMGVPAWSDLADFFNPATHDSIIQKYTTIAQFCTFAEFCMCSVPAATPTPPFPAMPVGLPDPPQLCTPSDLTTQLAMMKAELDDLKLLAKLIVARVGPQSYLLGASHNVTGRGEIVVSGISGVLVTALVIPAGVGSENDDPVRYFDLGFIDFGDSNGWSAHQRWLHTPQFFYTAPVQTSRVGYAIEAGVTAEIVELIPVISNLAS
jgi:hypothetical protein